VILAPLLVLLGIIPLQKKVEPTNLAVLLHLHQFIVTNLLDELNL
jgi:hypothetical protein